MELTREQLTFKILCINKGLQLTEWGFNTEQIDFITHDLNQEYLPLTIEQLIIYCNPKFSIDQMVEIWRGFNDNLSIDDIKNYAKIHLTSLEMSTFRRNLSKVF